MIRRWLMRFKWYRYRSYKKNLIPRLKESLKSAPPYCTEIHLSSLIYKEFLRINKEPQLEGKLVVENRGHIPGSWDFK